MPSTKTIEDIYTEFASGKYAMTIASAVRLGTSRANASFDGSTIQFCPAARRHDH